MSYTDHNKKSSKHRDVLSYFRKPQSKNLDSLHDLNSFEQPINERDVNTSQNASNNHITNAKIGSSSEPSEINAIQPKIDNDNVEGFSLGGNTNHFTITKKEERPMGRRETIAIGMGLKISFY